MIYDGSGSPAFSGDILIKGDRIEAVGKFDDTESERIIEGSGLAAAPGFIDTRLTRDAAKRKGIDWADAVKAAGALAALGCIGTPEDVAAAVSFLVGPDSRFITGQVLTVSGAP